MKQMVNRNAPALTTIVYGTLGAGFFRRPLNGGIFLAVEHGKETLVFPVLEDGSISRHTDTAFWPEHLEVIDILAPSALGIVAIKWANDTTPEI